MEPYITLILPAYNEAGAIVGTIESSIAWFETQGYTWEIIVAADGTDGTREVVKSRFTGDERVAVIGHPERRGKGRGVFARRLLRRGEVIERVPVLVLAAEELRDARSWSSISGGRRRIPSGYWSSVRSVPSRPKAQPPTGHRDHPDSSPMNGGANRGPASCIGWRAVLGYPNQEPGPAPAVPDQGG